MLGRSYDDQVCSLARALEIVGERWTFLIIRDAFQGISRFDDFQSSLSVARNVLADRLSRLVEFGVFHRVRYQERPERFEYLLTEKGAELATTIVALMEWGDRHLAGPEGPPRRIEHSTCGGQLTALLYCTGCHTTPSPTEVVTRPGPGADGPSPAARQAAAAAAGPTGMPAEVRAEVPQPAPTDSTGTADAAGTVELAAPADTADLHAVVA
jgi:DNA-binding HxlR family transcriptional regulator